jgi:hypothetical protein
MLVIVVPYMAWVVLVAFAPQTVHITSQCSMAGMPIPASSSQVLPGTICHLCLWPKKDFTKVTSLEFITDIAWGIAG